MTAIRFNRTGRAFVCALMVLLPAALTGCQDKEATAPTGGGFYNGPMKGKTVKGTPETGPPAGVPDTPAK